METVVCAFVSFEGVPDYLDNVWVIEFVIDTVACIEMRFTSKDDEVVFLGYRHAEYLWLADDGSRISPKFWIFGLNVTKRACDW